MTFRSETGQYGEDLACKYLIEYNYNVLQRNFRRPWGELDIVAKAPLGTLVFVEVKTMRQSGNENFAELKPEDNLSSAKLRKLQRTGQMFTGQFPHLVDEKFGWRIDLLAITLFQDREPKITHYENI